ncbi:MAG: Xaa-Pro peptidase family protein [Bacteroidota bacterium]
MTQDHLSRIQAALTSLGIPAWLLYSFRDSNPISVRMLGMTPHHHQTRRWACLIPAEGEPRGLTHRIEPHIGAMMPGTVMGYSNHEEFREGMRSLVAGFDRVAMEYSPGNAVPVVSRVDAGTVELVRSLGPDVISSGELLARMEAVLNPAQLESARLAGGLVREVMIDAFRFIRDRVSAGARLTEYDVQQHIMADFDRRGLITDHPPICGVGPNSANPHYEPTAERSSKIGRDDFVLIDLWARKPGADDIFGDITWVGYVGESVPEKYTRIFTIVRDARDAAYTLLRDTFGRGAMVTGAELDDAARTVIRDAGYAEYFTHRTGHSITTELHGAGANLDNFETEDTRPILAGTSFSIEPGIYLTGDFGVRSELDIVIGDDGVPVATSEPLQREVIAIMAME